MFSTATPAIQGTCVPVVERNQLIRLVSIGDLVKMPIAEIEMEATATQGDTA